MLSLALIQSSERQDGTIVEYHGLPLRHKLLIHMFLFSHSRAYFRQASQLSLMEGTGVG